MGVRNQLARTFSSLYGVASRARSRCRGGRVSSRAGGRCDDAHICIRATGLYDAHSAPRSRRREVRLDETDRNSLVTFYLVKTGV